MKKMMFLMLTFLIMGSASMNAQVQIGGTNGPDKSAVLDLNGDAGTATGGLALPRVELTSTTQQLNGVTAQPGTVVYNTGSALDGEGTYVWTKVDGSGSSTAFTGITKGAEGTDIAVGGNGTTATPLTIGIKTGGVDATRLAANSVDSTKIAPNAVYTNSIRARAVTVAKIGSAPADSGRILMSDGKSAKWVVQGSVSVVEIPDSVKNEVKTVAPKNFRQVYSAYVNYNLTPNETVRIMAAMSPAVAANSFCVANDVNYLVNSSSSGNLWIRAIAHSSVPIGQVLCWEAY
ncbi:hypothetical protein FACS189437_05230 [Bacteroidia bacterium]|nr:hypothetical protein FACS189437_05230 [Bacteroidia bacterium]